MIKQEDQVDVRPESASVIRRRLRRQRMANLTYVPPRTELVGGNLVPPRTERRGGRLTSEQEHQMANALKRLVTMKAGR